ncbi:hypothetical protein THMA_0746 [Thermotoga maritima MSB8]|nr:hypothetical protein THMC_0746 [Thermotoga maritima]AKE28510.1 hypothetical protein THMA_0746 [Thermotoga maritima MSB8]AKE30384.1 hypothetical protein THMB_0746 [Thermotoga maritima]
MTLGQGHREEDRPLRARVERWGKSPPASGQPGGLATPTWSKAKQGVGSLPLFPRVGRLRCAVTHTPD